MTTQWSSTYLYCHSSVEDLDSLITGEVGPISEAMIARGDADAWFFLRYWHGGPHLRVRFRNVTPESLEVFEEAMRVALRSVPAVLIDPERFGANFGTQDPVAWHPHGDVVRSTYEPETGRYGGPAGLAASEELFTLSSRIAVGILAAADRRQALLIGFDLILIALAVSEPEDLDAVRSVRGYFAAWDFLQESVTDGQAALERAEQLYETSRKQWNGRRARLDEVVTAQPDSTHGRWKSGLRDTLGQLRDQEAAGVSATDRRRILWSLVHMMNNRLGLTVADERAISWLASKAFPRWSVDPDYFPPGAAASDQAYLESSKYLRSQMGTGHGPRGVQVTSPRRKDGETPPLGSASVPFALPAIGSLDSGLQSALQNRRSDYGDYGNFMPLARLSALLGNAVGMAPGRRIALPDGDLTFRTYPSPSGAYATDVLVLAYAVDGLVPGTYAYDAAAHCLHYVSAGSGRSVLTAASPFFVKQAGGSAAIGADTVPAVVVLVANLGRLRPRYGLRALRLLLLEAGHMSQNLALCAGALGLKSLPISGYADDVLNAELHLDGVDRTVSAVLPVGLQSNPTQPHQDAAPYGRKHHETELHRH